MLSNNLPANQVLHPYQRVFCIIVFDIVDIEQLRQRVFIVSVSRIRECKFNEFV